MHEVCVEVPTNGAGSWDDSRVPRREGWRETLRALVLR